MEGEEKMSRGEMNRRVLLWLIAIALLTAVGCRPRHPPHTPQPLNMTGATSGFALINAATPAQCPYGCMAIRHSSC